MPRWLLLTLAFLVAALWWLAHGNSASLAATTSRLDSAEACRVLQAPGVVEGVSQTEQSAPAFRSGEATLTPLAGFSIAARVLAREDYRFGRESLYSPTDLALGWGPMSAPGLAEELDVTQGGRWYRYHWGSDGPPLSPSEIALDSANMHMVPANPAVAAQLALVRPDELVRLDGWLLRIDGDDGWRWQSSMRRDDLGTGACELVLVCSVRPR